MALLLSTPCKSYRLFMFVHLFVCLYSNYNNKRYPILPYPIYLITYMSGYEY